MEQVRDMVARAASGATRDERIEAYGRLVERFRDMACGYAYSILGDFHLAEDAAQEAFIVAFERLGQLEQPEAFAGWFRRIVWSCCGRMTRRKAVPTVALETAMECTSTGDAPPEHAEQNEMRQAVLKAIRELPAEQREATTLFYINRYSQRDIADFLEVPVGTVKNRLTASRGRLKERMLNMVEETLHQSAPDERFNKAIIDELISRPRLLEIPGHPVRQVWDCMREGLAEYAIIDSGNEVEDETTALAAGDQAFQKFAYRLRDGRALRFQMTSVTMSAVVGRRPPVRLLAAGRVFRPDKEDANHHKVFHQVDGVCIDAGVDVAVFKTTCELAIKSAVPDILVEWHETTNTFVIPFFEAVAVKGNTQYEVLGGGMLQPKTLQEKGFDPKVVAAFAWGLSLDRLAMLKFGIDDIRKLWLPPYIP